MSKEFISYNLASRMKALGFNEPCLASYRVFKILTLFSATTRGGLFKTISNSDILPTPHLKDMIWKEECTAPTWQSAFEWLIPQIDDEFKVCLGEDGWCIYNLENEVFEGEKALEKLCEIVEKQKKDGGKL